MKKCRCCGSQMEEFETRCSYCGTTTETDNKDSAQQNGNNYTSSYYESKPIHTPQNPSYGQEQSYSYQPYKYEGAPVSYDYNQYRQHTPVQSTYNGNNGILPLIMGLFSIFFGFSGFGFIFSIIAIITGAKSKNSTNELESRRGKIGFTIGIIMVVIEVLVFIFMLLAIFSAEMY